MMKDIISIYFKGKYVIFYSMYRVGKYVWLSNVICYSMLEFCCFIIDLSEYIFY